MPAETMTPPPAAPAPPPAPAPAPAPAPRPAPSSAPPPSAPGPEGGADNPFAAIDAKIKAADAPRPTTKGKDQTAPPEAPAAAKPPAGAKPPAQAASGPEQMRKELDRLKNELAQKTNAHTEMERRIAEAEARGKDVSVLTERLAQLEKERDELKAERRALNFEADDAFKQKYDAPFQEAAEFARQVILGMEVQDENGVRPATWEDFAELYALPRNKAYHLAREKFGENGMLVINQITELDRHNAVRKKALEEEKSKWKERQAQEESNRVMHRQKLGETWQKMNRDLSETNEDYRDPPEDKELAALRQEGLAIFDAQPKDETQRMVKAAHIRQMTAAFGPMKLRLLRLQQERDKLAAELDNLKSPTPGKNRKPASGTAGGSDSLSWEDAARKELL